MTDRFDAVIIGAGHHGLSTSYFLTQRGVSHCVLERGRIGESWLNLWTTFRTNTPKQFNRLPGFAYRGDDPCGFSSGAEVAAFLQSYARTYGLPVHEDSPVRSVRAHARGFEVETDYSIVVTRCVVVATGFYGTPRFPGCLSNAELNGVHILHSSRYRAPRDLPDGGVVIVGGGQSGAQIAEDLVRCGRRVFMTASGRPSNIRRILDKDFMELWEAGGILHQRYDETPEFLSGPLNALETLRRGSFPLVSGTDGNGLGHSITYESLARQGIQMLGRLKGARSGILRFESQLEQIRQAEKMSTSIRVELLEIYRKCFGADPDIAPHWDNQAVWNGDVVDEVRCLDEGISSIVCCTGFSQQWSWLKLAGVFDQMGYPLGADGISPWPGLYFLGPFFLQRLSTTCLCNEGRDAATIAAHLSVYLDAQAKGYGEQVLTSARPRESPMPKKTGSTVLVILPSIQDREELGMLETSEVTFEYAEHPGWRTYDPAGPDFDSGVFTQQCIARTRQSGLSGVFSSDDMAVLVASAIGEQTGVPAPSVAASLRANHKLYSRLSESSPVHFKGFALNGDEWLSWDTFPCQVKPASLSFSVLQRKAHDLAELRQAVEQLRAEGGPWERPFVDWYRRFVDPIQFPLAARPVFLIEEYVNAVSQHDVEGWADAEGRQFVWVVSDNNYSDGWGPLDNNSVPTRLSAASIDEATKLALETARLHGFRNGFWNIELWLMRDGSFRVTEVNGRMVSSMTALYRNVFGITQYPAALQLALGRPVDPDRHLPTLSTGFGGMFAISTPGRGRVSDLLRLAAIPVIRSQKDVVRFSLLYEPGAEVKWRQSGGSLCLARVWLVGDSYEAICDRAREIRSMLLL